MAAEKKFAEGEELRIQRTAEALRKAITKYEEALPLWREIGDRSEEAYVLYNMGVIYKDLGENQKALDLLNQALLLRRAVGDRGGVAATLNNIGLVYHSRGEMLKALDYFNQALPLLRAVGDHSGMAATLANIGFIHSVFGELQEALDYFSQALPLLEAYDRSGEATAVQNIGMIYSALGQPQKALDYHRQALLLRRAVSDHRGEAYTLNNIGNAHFTLGEKQKALDAFNQALSLRRGDTDRISEATALVNIGVVYSALGEPQKSLDYQNQALLLFRAVQNRNGEASTLNHIGEAYFALGEKQKALNYYNQALSLRRAVGDRSGEVITLGNIAQAERALGYISESRTHIESSLEIIESLRTKVVSQELRASYFATVQRYYEFYVDLLMQLHKQQPGWRSEVAALQVVERARARSMLESLTEARADIKQGVAPALLARERSLQRQLNQKAEEQLKLFSSSGMETQIEVIKEESDSLRTELQQVQTQIRQSSPHYAALTQPQPLTPSAIQQQVLDPNTLLLEYMLGEERSYLWAVTTKNVASYKLPKRAEIEKAERLVYRLLTERTNEGVEDETEKQKRARITKADRQYPAAAARLSRMLFGPVAQQLGKKRLLIVADGSLHYLPFGALPDPNQLKRKASYLQPLVMKHEIVNLPSASTLAVLRRELAGRKPAPKTLAVLADPVFTVDDERVKERAIQAVVKANGSAPNFAKQLIFMKLMQSELPINRLPYTRQEAEQILALVPAGEGMKALDFEASRVTAMSDRLGQYRYVHFATHGQADRERSELSTIVLSRFDEQGNPQEGFLRAHEVYNLNLPAELVVLSACETGLGKQVKGEGLVSLTRGFMYAGAARVVVSLWIVNDKATAELMTKFYRKMLVEGQRPAAALRAAQVEMWRNKRWQAPYYWAAFTLQGEWR